MHDGDAVVFRPIQPEWAADLVALERAAFPNIPPAQLYQEADLVELAEVFPEGNFAGWLRDEMVAMGTGHRTNFDFDQPDHGANGIYSVHNPDGAWYYGTTIAVRPELRGKGLGRQMYDLRKQAVIDLGLHGILAGSVIPGYADHLESMSAEVYMEKVVSGDLYDPTLSMQLENGFVPISVLQNYVSDPSIGGHAVLIMWKNPEATGTDIDNHEAKP